MLVSQQGIFPGWLFTVLPVSPSHLRSLLPVPVGGCCVKSPWARACCKSAAADAACCHPRPAEYANTSAMPHRVPQQIELRVYDTAGAINWTAATRSTTTAARQPAGQQGPEGPSRRRVCCALRRVGPTQMHLRPKGRRGRCGGLGTFLPTHLLHLCPQGLTSTAADGLLRDGEKCGHVRTSIGTRRETAVVCDQVAFQCKSSRKARERSSGESSG